MNSKRHRNLGSPVNEVSRGDLALHLDDLNRRNGKYILISPCRDEAAFMRQTLELVVQQTVRPAEWVIVNDGSKTDDSPKIVAEYAARHKWIKVVTRSDRGRRAVGAGSDRGVL